MVKLKDLPLLRLKPVSQFGSTTLKEVVGNEDTEIVVWRVRCPHCKTLMGLLEQENHDKMISINIDDQVNRAIRNKVEEWTSMTHYHIVSDDKQKLLEAFGITHVPFTEKVTVDLFENDF